MKELHARFQNLIIQILEKEGYQDFVLEPETVTSKGHRPGFITTNSSGEKFVAEVCVYRSSQISGTLVAFALKRLRQSISHYRKHGIKRGILVTSAAIPKTLLESLDFENSMFKVWDYPKLYTLVEKHPDLEIQFEQIINELRPFQASSYAEPIIASEFAAWLSENVERQPVTGKINVSESGDTIEAAGTSQSHSHAFAEGLGKWYAQKIEEMIEKVPEPMGAALETKIKASVHGNKGKAASEFEEICLEILKYLFEPKLVAWRKQSSTEQLHRFDAIARIASKHDFWQMLQSHYKAMYVIFEFKNHEDKITQHEIYTTEKYLYLPAMRSLAIVISREGANDNAQIAARGALREHGKVILNLSIEDVCNLLKLKDSGKDPEDGMIEILDEMLMKIER